MLRVLLWALVLLLLLAGAGIYYLLECRCELPRVQHAPFLPNVANSMAENKVPASASDWVVATRMDLEGARLQLERNSPIPFDRENARYGEWLVKGYEKGLIRAQSVSNYGGYSHRLAAYLNGFQDPHVSFGLVGDAPKGQWPGFIVSVKGGAAEVVFRDEADPSVPALGTKVVACDGKTLSALARERVFPFRFIGVLPSHQRMAVSRLFVDRQSPFVPRIQSCDVEGAAGMVPVRLAWRDLPPDEEGWTKQFQMAGSGPKAEWGVREVTAGVYWIGVPTFSSGDETAAKLRALISEVSKLSATMRRARAIVIDTRGNGGGNSAWAEQLAEAVFTKDVLAKYQATPRDTAIDWRASEENGAYWREWAVQMEKEFGRFSQGHLMGLFFGRQLSRFADVDPPIYRLGTCTPGKSGGWTTQRPNGKSPFPATVYMLSNGSCGSSCLNFADTVLMVPGVKLIGAATSGDGPYMDVRSVQLPSKLGIVTLPQKVERGAGRAALEYYRPDIAYDGLWTDEAVRNWTLEIVQRDAK